MRRAETAEAMRRSARQTRARDVRVIRDEMMSGGSGPLARHSLPMRGHARQGPGELTVRRNETDRVGKFMQAAGLTGIARNQLLPEVGTEPGSPTSSLPARTPRAGIRSRASRDSLLPALHARTEDNANPRAPAQSGPGFRQLPTGEPERSLGQGFNQTVGAQGSRRRRRAHAAWPGVPEFRVRSDARTNTSTKTRVSRGRLTVSTARMTDPVTGKTAACSVTTVRPRGWKKYSPSTGRRRVSARHRSAGSRDVELPE